MTDQFIQSMFAVFDNSPKCLLYKYVVSNNLCLSIETGRYHHIDRNNRICSLCNMNILENEYHFVLVCPLYSTIRDKYIKPYYYKTPSRWHCTKSSDCQVRVRGAPSNVYGVNVMKAVIGAYM